jgi:hypothetical protein
MPLPFSQVTLQNMGSSEQHNQELQNGILKDDNTHKDDQQNNDQQQGVVINSNTQSTQNEDRNQNKGVVTKKVQWTAGKIVALVGIFLAGLSLLVLAGIAFSGAVAALSFGIAMSSMFGVGGVGTIGAALFLRKKFAQPAAVK